LKVSIITVVLNGQQTIEDCLRSVYCQTYPDIEHIVIDGGSKDGTLGVIERCQGRISRLISEPDNGIYDAMNKGIKQATGDIIGILNCDDIYANNDVIASVVTTMQKNNADTCYGDLLYVKRSDISFVVREWYGKSFSKSKFKYGWMPPHPTFFVKRSVYSKFGLFNTSLDIAADYELMLRFLYKNNVTVVYLPKILVKMRSQGRSSPSLLNTAKMICEEYKAWKINKLKVTFLTFILKRLRKTHQFFKLFG
jgi:glycosyltransferase involved in cell wall biosynthesis